jgi:hypothetical protein
MAFTITSSTDVVTQTMLIASCRWWGAAAAGQTCSWTDLSGNPIFDSKANGANFIDGWVFGRRMVNGLKSTAMDSGSITFYRAI